jgi:hypothetical protein
MFGANFSFIPYGISNKRLFMVLGIYKFKHFLLIGECSISCTVYVASILPNDAYL